MLKKILNLFKFIKSPKKEIQPQINTLVAEELKEIRTITKDELEAHLKVKGLRNVKMFSIIESKPKEYIITLSFSDYRGTYIRRTWLTPDYKNITAMQAYRYTSNLLEVISTIIPELMSINESLNINSPTVSILINFDQGDENNKKH
jgi:hypothetical protein